MHCSDKAMFTQEGGGGGGHEEVPQGWLIPSATLSSTTGINKPPLHSKQPHGPQAFKCWGQPCTNMPPFGLISAGGVYSKGFSYFMWYLATNTSAHAHDLELAISTISIYAKIPNSITLPAQVFQWGLKKS